MARRIMASMNSLECPATLRIRSTPSRAFTFATIAGPLPTVNECAALVRHRERRIFAAPDWDLAQIGPVYLREAQAFLQRQARAKEPFFLYYVPNANHYQRNEKDGDYACPKPSMARQ